MSTTELPASDAAESGVSQYNLLLTTFIAAIFVSAALLFAVQPMFTKMVLPQLGGAAAVWSVAMVFFQTTLLAGYAYAHLLTRFVPARISVIIHLALMLVACFALPLHIITGWGRPPPQAEAFWLLGLFTLSIGLPFFALAANGPLLQAWFVRTDHPDAKDPYFLYAASNAGSFLALVAYPIVIEPFIQLSTQTWLWTVGFYVLILLIGACGVLKLRTANAATIAQTVAMEAAAPPTWINVGSWVFLTAVPSGLLIAVTAYIAIDVAAVPLLWVLPLALYLLTFVIVFQTHPVIPHALVVKVQPIFVLGLVAATYMGVVDSAPGLIALHLSTFFVCALLCHGELARRRPPPRYLTGYYMWISFGGMIGGIATGLIAPHVFGWVAEYPLLLVLAVLARPGRLWSGRGSGQFTLLSALCAMALLLFGMKAFDFPIDGGMYAVFVGVLLGLTIQFWHAPTAFAAIIAFLLIGNHYLTETMPSKYSVRNFFGVLNVTESTDGIWHVLMQGITGQGTQRMRDNDGNPITGRPEMISEFFAGAGLAQTFDAVRARIPGPINFAVIGLGTGTLACQVHSGDKLTYYELDQDVVRIARDPALFTFVTKCAPDVPIVLGDARLTLADAPDGSYDFIMIDAFLNAAIPIHLLTREAMELYFRKLKPHGMLAMHISNRNLELASVVAGIADANGLIARVYNGGDVEEDPSEGKWIPRVAAVARSDEDFGPLAKSEYWPVYERDPAQRVWTDNYSNIVGSVLRNLRERRQQ